MQVGSTDDELYAICARIMKDEVRVSIESIRNYGGHASSDRLARIVRRWIAMHGQTPGRAPGTQYRGLDQQHDAIVQSRIAEVRAEKIRAAQAGHPPREHGPASISDPDARVRKIPSELKGQPDVRERSMPYFAYFGHRSGGEKV